MRYWIILPLLLSLLWTACQTTSPEEKREKQLVEDIHRIHDVETMPKMGYMLELQKKLRALESPEGTASLILQLERADNQMMDWMRGFNWPSEQTPIAERIKYYEVEVGKLEDLKKNMYQAIEQAEKKLGS